MEATDYLKEVLDSAKTIVALLVIGSILKGALALGYNHTLLAGGVAIVAGLGGYQVGKKKA